MGRQRMMANAQKKFKRLYKKHWNIIINDDSIVLVQHDKVLGVNIVIHLGITTFATLRKTLAKILVSCMYILVLGSIIICILPFSSSQRTVRR